MTAEKPDREPNLAEAIGRRFRPLGGVDDLPPPPASPPDWLQQDLPAADEAARKRRREVLRAEDLTEADLAAIANGEMDPRHRHLDDELGYAALEAWNGPEAKAARIAQARALKAQAGKGGLRFEAYLPPGLAEWLLDLIERGVFADPAEAGFVIFGEHRELEPHADLRRELLSRSCQAAMVDPRPSLSGDEVEKHFQELSAAPLPESAVWRKTP
jgi:hypothetical protein